MEVDVEVDVDVDVDVEVEVDVRAIGSCGYRVCVPPYCIMCVYVVSMSRV